LRLTQLKLAGFKSFVDPTAIDVPGQLVGIVGPNGCGKSNLIDAVRWVLGESKASALRGDSMQDVIFSGSGQRKPVARASVELLFDNSLGKAAGQWSQYGEISVKRVLTRDGDSSYLINNLNVRRRDIHDIFLGTGLGPRAYAIIEQGMISRIIEAKPEELRVFLEEAAGVSKYKERRRETENRLSDARENLSRVADIQRELESQIEKLTAQAEVARQYRELQGDLAHQQHLFWLVKRNDASHERDRHTREIERATTGLEAETAKLRGAEKQLETARSEQYAASDIVNAAQGAYYNANAEVQRLETEIRHVSENRLRVENQITQLRAAKSQAAEQAARLETDLTAWQQQSAAAVRHIDATRQTVEAMQQAVPAADEIYRQASLKRDAAREAATEVEQALQIEGAHHSHAEKALANLQARHDRLLEEQEGMSAPDAAELAAKTEEHSRLEAELADAQSRFDALQAAAEPLENARKRAQDDLNAATQALTEVEARIAALRQLQESVKGNGKLTPWLAKHGLDAMQRLWQRVRVEAGWETALEAVLRERLNGIEVRDLGVLASFFSDAPPAKLTFVAPLSGIASGSAKAMAARPLRELVTPTDSALAPLFDEWLSGVYLADDAAVALAARASLPEGDMFVTRDGHLVTRQAVSFYAADSEQHGLLKRQNEIESLTADAATRRAEVDQARSVLVRAETDWQQNQLERGEVSARVTQTRTVSHQCQMEVLRLTQIAERVNQRSEQIQRELDEIAEHQTHERENKAKAEANFEQFDADLARLQEEFETVREAHELAEQNLDAARRKVSDAEREMQEAVFQDRQCTQKIEEIRRLQESNSQHIAQLASQIAEVEAELATLAANPHAEALQVALAAQVEADQALKAKRQELDALLDALRGLEEERTGSEQRLEPLRERINELKLKEQAAQIASEQFATQLAEANVDAEQLAASLEKGMRANALQAKINELQAAIEALGAVNLAALEELEASRERKGFLDRQFADLTEAIETLEAAIKRIDRESRALLQDTFDAVNDHFGRLFPKIFGGGDAKLIMTGEEILDAGVQVMAQPPGKKTTTIHLLSGGEKALTALALVFAIFQLNPAPFCLLDEVDAPLDDTNTERFCEIVKEMAKITQFVFISHNKITMEMAQQLIGVTMQESGVSRVVAVDIDEAVRMRDEGPGGPRAAAGSPSAPALA
jgi:chromosome segregation protein